VSLRISATLLESFRLFYAGDAFPHDEAKAKVDDCYCENCWEARLIAAIKGAYVPQTVNMRVGHAYHYLLEHPQLSLEGVYERNGFRFAPSAIEAVLERLTPGGVFETKVARSIGVTREGDQLVLVSKADHIAGLHISEFKAPLGGSFDAEKYMDSYQWRVMMMLYEANMVTYHIACLKEVDDDVLTLKSIDSMNLFPYPTLESDVKLLVRELLRYVRTMGLDSYLRREDSKAVPA